MSGDRIKLDLDSILSGYGFLMLPYHVKSSKSENPQKMEFALFWCKGTPWGVIQESRIFFRSDQYFGFYGGLKF